MSVNLYRSDGTTLLDGLAITGLEAGADSDVATIKVKNDGATTALNVLLVMRTVDPGDVNTLLASGVPPQDEMWGRMRITAGATTTDWRHVGAYSGLLIGDIAAGATVTVEFKLRPPSLAETAPWTFVPLPIYNEYSQPVPPSLTRVDRGILTGIGDYSHSGIVSGCEVTATGTPDDEVHCAAGFWVHNGTLYGKIATDHQLDQDDSAAAALASGESYKARISLGAGTATATKGVKAASPTAPTMPTGDLLAPDGEVTVEYQVGGTSVIETADLGGTGGYDRYTATADGLDVILSSGQAQGGSTHRYSHGELTVPVTDDATSYVWQLASGLPDADASATAAPEDTALGPWWKAVAAAGVVTLTDLRTYAGQTVTIRLRGTNPGSVGEVESQLIEHERLFLEQVVYRISDNGGTSGQTKLQVKKNGTTIYTDFAVQDQRPTFAHDAATLTHSSAVHQVTEYRKGDVVSLETLEYPPDGTPAWSEAYLIFRKP